MDCSSGLILFPSFSKQKKKRPPGCTSTRNRATTQAKKMKKKKKKKHQKPKNTRKNYTLDPKGRTPPFRRLTCYYARERDQGATALVTWRKLSSVLVFQLCVLCGYFENQRRVQFEGCVERAEIVFGHPYLTIFGQSILGQSIFGHRV